MNNLEFRALYKLTNKYANIDSIDFTNQIVVLTSYPLVRSFGLDKVAFDEVIIEQYTGLKDKNGKKIYEGDIVKTPNHTAEIYYDIDHSSGFVAIEKGMRIVNFAVDDEPLEVIGNIHENHELLGKEQL